MIARICVVIERSYNRVGCLGVATIIRTLPPTAWRQWAPQRVILDEWRSAMSGTGLTPDQMNTIARDQATKVRVLRKVLQPAIGQGYVDSVPGHRVIKGPSLTLR